MGRNSKWQTTTETVAIGIEGDRHSLCGAIKRLECDGFQWNGLLSLKEQCARRIARLENKQIKYFILAWLPSNLFEYVTEDIFDLHRIEFTSNFPENHYMCQECSMASYEPPCDDCQCPNMYAAIDKLNNRLFKRSGKTIKRMFSDDTKQFELIYKIPNDEQCHYGEEKRPKSCFLYLSPVEHRMDMDSMHSGYDGAFDGYQIFSNEITIEDKLLFVDFIRLLGGFRINQEEVRLILYRRREFHL